MKLSEDKKIAIVCDWLTGIGGAEQVVLELHRMYPEAPIYTSQYDPTRIDWFKEATVITTWVNKLPKSLKKFLPVFRAMSFSKLDLSDYELVISSSGAEAKGVKTGANTVHVCYCHSPTHYYWTRYDDYMANPGFGSFDWLARIGLRTLVKPMRNWDFRAAQKPSYLVTNSNYSKANILRYYKRDSTVIYPPVDIEKYSSEEVKNEQRDGFVVVGRQTPYKRIDLAVAACTKLNVDLVVIGDGPENKKIRSFAGPSINFVGQVSDNQKADYLKSAKALIFPGVDDFGITAVEALASGTPVIAFNEGGVLDYIDKDNGLLFGSQTIDSLSEAINKFEDLKFDHHKVKLSSFRFSTKAFREDFDRFISSL